jgi:hypothetical protein
MDYGVCTVRLDRGRGATNMPTGCGAAGGRAGFHSSQIAFAERDGGRMSDGAAPAEGPAETHSASAGRSGRWLALALGLAVLAGCEHGPISFDSSSGQFRVPLGAGSGQGTNR